MIKPSFGKWSFKNPWTALNERIDELSSATYIKYKNRAWRTVGGLAAAVGGKGLYDGYYDEFERGLHSPDNSFCGTQQVEPGFFVEKTKDFFDTVVDQVVPLLPCHVSLPSLTLVVLGGFVLLAPKRTQLILADLNERVPAIVNTGINRAKQAIKKIGGNS